MKASRLKGSYTLIIEIERDRSIRIGKFGSMIFEKGYWVYVGSAQGTGSTNLENRLRRHFRKEKKIHWHIDHLLNSNAILRDAIWSESEVSRECDIANALVESREFEWGHRGFGAGDCSGGCVSHLLRFSKSANPIPYIEAIFRTLGLVPITYSNSPL